MLPLVVLSGCTSLSEFFGTAPNKSVSITVVPLDQRPVEEPLAADNFVLLSDDQSIIGEPQVVFAKESDTLSDIARAYGLGYDEIVAANPDVNPWLPGENTPVVLPTQYVLPDVPREGIVLNIASKRLFYFPESAEGEPQIVKTYPIGIGRVGWETPIGNTAVVAKARDPHWYVPASVRKEHAEQGDPLPAVVPPGPDNPLGHRVLQLDMPGYLIHGTNQPYGVGMRVSHGCVRLYPENIDYLYELVEVGETVSIINEPYLIGRLDGDIYFEAHEPLEDDDVDPANRLDHLLDSWNAKSDCGLRDADIARARGIARAAVGTPLKLDSPDDEITARARVVHNVVKPEEEAPTLADVREMIDEATGDQSTGADEAQSR